MRAADTLARAIVLATIACSGPDAVGADAQNLPLPDVTVTAPPITPPWKKWSPYLGNPRVEETKWPDIPCNNSRIASGAASACKAGPSLNPPAIGVSQGNPSIQVSNCRIAHDLVMTNDRNLKIEADVLVFDPTYVSAIGHQHRGCFVEAGYSDLREDFPDMNQMTREGNNWRNFVEAGDLSAMVFSIGSSDCRAVEKRGPQWREGYTYVIHASICRTDGHPVEAADIDRVLGSLQVREYEPRGNVRSPAQ
jgi:hypothetical protein